MIKSVDEYLGLLKNDLAGSDPALIQDALSDAEEHLRTALAQQADAGVAESDAMMPIVDKFGSPEEVAAGYRQIEKRVPVGLARVSSEPRRSVPGRFFGVFGDARAWGAMVYMLLALATGIIYFAWVVTGISVSAGLLVLVVGLPLLALFLLSVRVVAFVEGRLVEALLGLRMPRRPLFLNQNVKWWPRMKGLFTSRTTWTAIAYFVLQLPLGIFYFTVAVTMIAVAVYGILSPLTSLIFDTSAYSFVIGDTMYRPAGWAIPFFVLGGVVLLTLTMHVAKLVGRLHGRWAKAMLVSTERERIGAEEPA
jgi:uncharacterized membrane protein